MGFKTIATSKYESLGYRGPLLPERVGEVFTMPLEDGRFGAFQILWENKCIVETIALDWIGDEPATLEKLKRARALDDSHYMACGDEAKLPRELVPIGKAPLFAPVRESTLMLAFGDWDGIAEGVYRAWHWKHVVPHTVRLAYETARDSRASVSIEVHPGSPETHRERDSNVRVMQRAGVQVQWHALDALAALSAIEFEGDDQGVVSYAASRILVTHLNWKVQGLRRIDLRGAGLESAHLTLGDEVDEVIIGADLKRLVLSGDYAQLEIRSASKGRGLALHAAAVQGRIPNFDLPLLTGLTLTDVSSISLAKLHGRYPELRELSLDMDFGSIVDIAALGHFKHLRSLALRNCYDYDPEQFPGCQVLQALDRVLLVGLRRSAVRPLRRIIKEVRSLIIGGAKSDAWIAEHGNHPFGQWMDENAELSSKAMSAYTEACTVLRALGERGSASQALAVLESFVLELNQLDAKFGFETTHRETAADVCVLLMTTSAIEVEVEESLACFDACREF